MRCAAGFEVPKNGRCTICGAAPKMNCQKNIKDKQAERERQRVKQIADRAEQRARALSPDKHGSE
jgi:hypothetical protein